MVHNPVSPEPYNIAQNAEGCEEALLQAWRRLRFVGGNRSNRSKNARIMSCLLELSVRPSFDDLAYLTKLPAAPGDPSADDWLHIWCLQSVISAENPFIPGMTLSVLLSKRAEVASEGEQRIVVSLRERIDALLLEVLERLPKTVRGFPGGMEGCVRMFEPEGDAQSSRCLPGPLTVALQNRLQMEIYGSAPLVMDFLSLVFSKGLPGLRDTVKLGDDSHALEYLCGEGHESLVVHQSRVLNIHDDGTVLQGTLKYVGAFTVLPGAQFIAAGIVAKPSSYYKVPALRMALDFLVYVGMLVFFFSVVLLYEERDAANEEGTVLYEDVAITWGEISFAVYVVVSRVKISARLKTRYHP